MSVSIQNEHMPESKESKARKSVLPNVRVVTRYVGSGIKGAGSGIRAPGSGITAVGSGIRTQKLGSKQFLKIETQLYGHCYFGIGERCS